MYTLFKSLLDGPWWTVWSSLFKPEIKVLRMGLLPPSPPCPQHTHLFLCPLKTRWPRSLVLDEFADIGGNQRRGKEKFISTLATTSVFLQSHRLDWFIILKWFLICSVNAVSFNEFFWWTFDFLAAVNCFYTVVSSKKADAVCNVSYSTCSFVGK